MLSLLPASPQQNGIAERRIGMVMDVARTSMIRAAAPHFLWPFAVQYAAHQINLQPPVSLLEITPTLRWTGKVGDASVFRVSLLEITPTLRWTGKDIKFDESVSYYCLFPYRTASLPPSPLFLAPGAPPVDPLPPQGPAPSGVSQVDPVEPVEVAVDSGAARGAEPAGVGPGGAERGVAKSEGAEPRGAELERVEPRGAEPGGAESRGAELGVAEPECAESGGPPGVPSLREPLSPQRLREWYARRRSRAAGATGPAARGASGGGAAGGAASAGAARGDSGAGAAGGVAGAGAAGGAAGAGGTGAIGGAAGVGAAGGTGAAAAGGVAGVGAVRATGGAAGAGTAVGTGAGGAAGVVAGHPEAEGTGAVSAISGGAVLQRFGFTYSSPQSTPLPTGHSLSAPPSDESVEPSGSYPELVGCLIYLMTCTRPDLAFPLSILARYVAPGRHRNEHIDAAKRLLRYLCSTSGMGLVLGGRARVVLTGHADASWVDELATQRSSQGYTFSLGSGSVSWRSARSSSVLSSICEAEIYAEAMDAQELRWLTYLLTDLGEAPRSPPVLYVDNKAMLALCQEHRLEHRTKHIALRYFLARELQQRGQLRLAYVATQANTTDIFTKALQPCDHQRLCTMLDLVPTWPHLLTS
ncbi:unnamed protein product [Closterium sp. NIES-53]